MKTHTDQADLAEVALESEVAVCSDSRGRLGVCDPDSRASPDPHTNLYGSIVGVVCPPGTTAVAYCLDTNLRSAGTSRPSRIAVSVPIVGVPVIVTVDGRRLFPGTRAATIIDLGRRALGLPTPRPGIPLVELLDRIWLDRVLAAVLRADLGNPPPWTTLASLHPAMPHRGDPDLLRIIRSLFHTRWETLRRRIADAEIRWPGMPPGVAGWLDAGSLSRWCLADTPDPEPIIDDLDQLLDPVAARRLRESIAVRPACASRHGGASLHHAASGHGRKQ